MKGHGEGCFADLGSLTLALKAQKLLGAAAIPSAVIKNSSSSRTNKGCSYGLRFSCSQSENVKKVLTDGGIRVREWKL